MELSEEEKKVIAAMRKIPETGQCRISIAFENGKVVKSDLTLLEQGKTK